MSIRYESLDAAIGSSWFAAIRDTIGIAMLIGSANVFAAGPCDIYAAAGTPCVAAHSTVRALYAAYAGPLYQVRRTSDGKTKDIGVLVAGGYVDIATQDSFLNGAAGTISILYDQSSKGNHLRKAPVAHLLTGSVEGKTGMGKVMVNGHVAYGIYVSADSVAYRNNSTSGIATGDQAESMYMVVDGTRFSAPCCFDYGNAETTGNDDGAATMEAVYWGTDWLWGGHGDGNGPWVAADLEEGMYKSDTGGRGYSNLTWSNDKSVIAKFATAMLKGPSGNKFGLKAGDAQSGKLVTMWNGARPSGYSPMKKEGAIILGTGGDGSHGGVGTFYEGAMTIGNPPDSIDDKIQANIVAAGYGDSTPSMASPVFTSASSFTIHENTTAVATCKTTSSGTVTYAINGGDDAAEFSIGSSSGVLAFKTAPSYAHPTDADSNNLYKVRVFATNAGGTATQAITVTVTQSTSLAWSQSGLAMAHVEWRSPLGRLVSREEVLVDPVHPFLKPPASFRGLAFASLRIEGDGTTRILRFANP